MSGTEILAKLVALSIVGGVAKALFGSPVVHNYGRLAETAIDTAKTVVDTAQA